MVIGIAGGPMIFDRCDAEARRREFARQDFLRYTVSPTIFRNTFGKQ